jgi:arylsulfatase A-like enzyme
MLRMTIGIFFLGVLAPASVAAEPPPNIVLILADDLGIGDLGCYNRDSKIPTPHMDRLAREGMRFTDAHSPSGVCTPTRYGLLTGRYAWRTRLKQGVLQGEDAMLIEEGRMTLASLLKQKGYATSCVGKWHLGLGPTKPTDYTKPMRPGPLTVGFDYFFGIPASLDMVPYVYVENEQTVELPTAKIGDSASQREGGTGFWRGGAIAPSFKHIDVLPKCSEKALAFLERQTKERRGKPFFLYLPLSAPHTPWLPTKEWAGKSKAGPYGDFVMQTDHVVGQVLGKLDQLKLTDNTLVILTSDNGAHWLPTDIEKYDHRANGPWRGQKADSWEGGHRVPFLVRWPGQVKSGTISNETICHVDFLATFAEIVATRLPEEAGEDSFSWLTVLRGTGEGRPIRPFTILHSSQGLFVIRQGSMKYIDGLGSGGFSLPRTEKPIAGGPTGQLYDLTADPAEKENLSLKQPKEAERLKALLEEAKRKGRTR